MFRWILEAQYANFAALQNIFADAGVEWKWYRYFDAKTVGLDFEGLMEDIRAAPEGSVIVLHGEQSPAAVA